MVLQEEANYLMFSLGIFHGKSQYFKERFTDAWRNVRSSSPYKEFVDRVGVSFICERINKTASLVVRERGNQHVWETRLRNSLFEIAQM